MKQPVRVLLVGSAGRMGQTIVDLAKGDAKIDIVALCDQGDALEPAISHSDVVLDFSHASALEEICRAASKYKQPLVIGTTGHSGSHRQTLNKCAKVLPIVLATNFSVGVNTLFWLTKNAAEMLGPEFDLEIVETHHRMKKDSPSGTAKTLVEILQNARKIDKVRHGREGDVGKRPADEIAVHSIRGGDVVGDHTVLFAGPGERLELIHRASSRETFGKGALRAAQWVVGKPPGFYSMQDVLGL
ncbi:MAG: 4-hydroxy-tetrahydrodipicolinate reductase [Spartobacteria bacterium]